MLGSRPIATACRLAQTLSALKTRSGLSPGVLAGSRFMDASSTSSSSGTGGLPSHRDSGPSGLGQINAASVSEIARVG